LVEQQHIGWQLQHERKDVAITIHIIYAGQVVEQKLHVGHAVFRRPYFITWKC